MTEKINWKEFNAPMRPGYFSGWRFEWPGFFVYHDVPTHHLPNRFRRWMQSLVFGVKWTRT